MGISDDRMASRLSMVEFARAFAPFTRPGDWVRAKKQEAQALARLGLGESTTEL